LKIIPGVDVLVARIADCQAALFPEEEAEVSRAVHKRRREFAAGRALACIALAELGHPPRPIPRLGRAPVWPPGIVGSITHSNEYVAVCVAEQTTHTAVGVDIEAARRVTDMLEARILTPEEMADTKVSDAGTLRFACKEAVYKAVDPMVGEFFGFHAVRIELDAQSGTFTAVPVQDGPFAEPVARGRGVFLQLWEHHLAGFYIGSVLNDPIPRSAGSSGRGAR